MLVKLATTLAGPIGVIKAGSVADLPDDQAKALIAGGYAVASQQAPKPAGPKQAAESHSPEKPKETAKAKK